MQKLSRSASGQRHLRWVREITATSMAHMEHNYLLTPAQKQALEHEGRLLAPLVDALTRAVTPYRDFVDNAHVMVRARQRVGDFLCDEAQRESNGRLLPRKREIDDILRGQGGFAAILSKTRLSRVLNAGREMTVKFARNARDLVRSLPPTIPGAAEVADLLHRAADTLAAFNQQSEDLEATRAPLRLGVQKAVYELREALDQMDGRLRTHFSQDFIDSLYPELTARGTAIADEPDDEDDNAGPPQP